MSKKILMLLLAGITIISFIACEADTSSKKTDSDAVKIAYLPITHALALFEEAEELKENTGLDIELVKYGSWPELMDALNTGRVDGASVLIELAMKAKEQGIQVKAVALGHRDGNVIVVSNAIDSIKDLKGKTFAIPHRQSSHNLLLNDALSQEGLTIDDLEVTELAPTEMASALASGQIDGYCVAEPFGAQAIYLDVGKVLYSSAEIWKDSLCCGLVLTEQFIEERPEVAKEFVDTYKTAGKNLTSERAKEIAKKYLKQNKNVLDISLEWISYDNLDLTEKLYDELVERVKKYGLSDNPPSYSDFVEDTF